MASAPPEKSGTSTVKAALTGKEQHIARKQLRNLEKTIARLDGQKKELNAEMLNSSDASRAMELHNQINAIQVELSAAEETWCEMSEDLGDWE